MHRFIAPNYIMLGNHLTDSELFEAILLDNEQAFNQLFERHWFKVYSVAYRYVKDEETALEIAHDIFLNIWTKRHQLHINSFKNYVITAASYHGIRKKQTEKAIPVKYIEDYQYTDDHAFAVSDRHAHNQGEINIDEQEINNTVDHLLDGLPKRCREIYQLSRKENLSITEIAERLNISKRTVENQLTAALKHLRASLKIAVVISLMVDRFL